MYSAASSEKKELNELCMYEALRRAQEIINAKNDTDTRLSDTQLLNQLRILVPYEFDNKNLTHPNKIAMFELPYGSSVRQYLARRDKAVWAMIDRFNGWHEINKDQFNSEALKVVKDYFDLIAENHRLLLKTTIDHKEPNSEKAAYAVVPTDTSATVILGSELPENQTITITNHHQTTGNEIAEENRKKPIEPITMEEREREFANHKARPAQNTNATTQAHYTPANQESGYLSCCCIATVHCISFTANILGSSAQQHYRAEGVASQQNGEGISWSAQSIFSGETGGYADAYLNEEMHNCCSGIFGNTTANICCPGHMADQGVAASMNGEGAPNCLSNPCGWLAYQDNEMNESFFSCWTGCFSNIGTCCERSFNNIGDGCVQAANQIGNGCQTLCDGETWSRLGGQIEGLGSIICKALECCGGIPGLLADGAEGLCHFTREIINILGSCNLNGCDGDGEALGKIIGAIGSAAVFVWASITGKGSSASDEGRRRLLGETATSGEFLPSTIIMSVAVVMLGPRLAARVFEASNNIYDGVAVEQNMRLLASELGGATIAVGLGFAGGASAVTFATLLLACMQMSHEATDRYNRTLNGGIHGKLNMTIDGDLPSWARLSVEEWAVITKASNGENAEALNAFTTQVLTAVEQASSELNTLNQSSMAMTAVSKTWPQITSAYVRYNQSEDIKQARDFSRVTITTANI